MTDRWLVELNVFSPPPAAPDAWKSGSVPGRDYERDLRSAFDSDPILAAHVCATTFRTNPRAGDDTTLQLRNILKRVCSTVSDDVMLRAVIDFRIREEAARVSGLMNTFMDSTVALTNEQREKESKLWHEQLAKMQRVDQKRFEIALRALVLDPGDWRNASLVMQYSAEGMRKSDLTTPDQMIGVVQGEVDRRARLPQNRGWKRARRNLLALRGEIAGARQAASQIKERDARDQIFSAFLDRLAGDRRSYDALLANCPAADTEYIVTRGKPSPASRFCEDLMADLARGFVARLGTKAPQAVTDIAIETNRVLPKDPKVAGGAWIEEKTESEASREVGKVTALINNEIERAVKMSRVERLAAAERILDEHPSLVGDFETAIRLLALAPAREVSAASAVYAARYRGGSSEADHPAMARRLILRAIEQRAARADAEASEWKRARRNALLFAGEYTAARDAAREIVERYPDPRFEMRDRMFSAVMERVHGNDKVYSDVVKNCPRSDDYDPEISTDLSSYCRRNAWWNVGRVIQIHQEKTPPVFNQILVEVSRASDDDGTVMDTLRHLVLSDPAMAEREIKRVLSDPKVSQVLRRDAMYSMSEAAEKLKKWAEAGKWYDAFIRELGEKVLPFPQDGWKLLGQMPQRREAPLSSRFIRALHGRVELSLRYGLEKDIERSIERVVPYAIATQNPALVQRLLLDYVGTKPNGSSVKRVLGYLAKQDLSDDLSARLNHYREQLKITPEGLPAADSPWETKSDPQREREPQPPPVRSVST